MKNKNLEVWQSVFSTRSWGKYPDMNLIRFIGRNYFSAENREDIHIMELGFGTGANLTFLAKEGFTISGIEGTQEGLKQTHNRLSKETLDHRIDQLICGDYEDLPFDDNAFDAIIDIESLSCNSFEKSQHVIENAVKKLKPDGRFFSLTFSLGTWGSEDSNPQKDYHLMLPESGPLSGIGEVRFASRDDIDKLYNSNGLKIVNLELSERHFVDQEKKIGEWVVEAVKL